MGRRAKYQTDKERREASNRSKKAYAQTEHAKQLRVEQNRRAYLRRQEAQKPEQGAEFILPTIPLYIRQLAKKHVPLRNPLFYRSYELNSPLEEEEEYAQFTQPPPYNISEDLAQVGWSRASVYTQGRQEKALHQSEEKRLVEQYNRLSLKAFRAAIHADIVHHLQGWQDLCDSVKRGCSRLLEWDSVMGKGVLQWEARLIMSLVEDWESVSGQEDNYISLYMDRLENRRSIRPFI